MKSDTISEWRRLFRKYRAQGYGLLWCVTISWKLERLGRNQRTAVTRFGTRKDRVVLGHDPSDL